MRKYNLKEYIKIKKFFMALLWMRIISGNEHEKVSSKMLDKRDWWI